MASTGKSNSGGGGGSSGGAKKPFKRKAGAGGGKGGFKGGKGGKGGKGKSTMRKPLTQAQKEMDAKKARLQRRLEKPHGNAIEEAKGLWNKAREKALEPEARAALVTQIMALIDGKVVAVATRHDASRILQLCITHGTDEQRQRISTAVKDKIVPLSKTTYGRFLVTKLLARSKGKERAMLLKQFQGHMVKLGTHNVSALVIEDLFDKVLSAKQCAYLFQEFYSPEFVHFKRKDTTTLSGILRALVAAGEGPKCAPVLSFTLNTVQRMANKGLMSLGFVQFLLWQYIQAAGAEGVKHVLPYVVEVAPALLRTRPGTNSVLECVALGDAKARKQIARAMKPDVLEWARHPYGHLVLVRLMDVTDDTVMIKNSLLKPCLAPPAAVATAGAADSGGAAKKMKKAGEGAGTAAGEEAGEAGGLLGLLVHPRGSKLVLQLLTPCNPRVFGPEELAFLQPSSSLTVGPAFEAAEASAADSAAAAAVLAPLNASRKEPAKRRAELLAFLKDPLLRAVRENLARLVADRHGCHVVEAVVASQWLSGDAGFADALAAAAVTAPAAAGSGRCQKMDDGEGEEEEEEEEEENDAEGGDDSEAAPVAPVLDARLHTSFRRMLKGPGGAALAPRLLDAMKGFSAGGGSGGLRELAADANSAHVLVSVLEVAPELAAAVRKQLGGAKFFKGVAVRDSPGAQALKAKLDAAK